MFQTYTITDNNTGETVTIEADQVIESLTPWFDGDAETTKGLENLQDALKTRVYSGGFEAFLDITVVAN